MSDILWKAGRMLGGVVLNESPLEKSKSSRIMMVSHWLSCQTHLFLTGFSICLSLLESVMDDSFLLVILLLESVTDRSS